MALTRFGVHENRRRLSYDGSLCTVRFHGGLNGTKGAWLGVEWDDSARGKHSGKHQGQQIFTCQSDADTAASFIRPTRKPDKERTVLEAIRHKYSGSLSDETGKGLDVVVISGKVAEEVGFEKIAQEQAQLADLRIVLIDQLIVNGISPRGASPSAVSQAQEELSQTCPNIYEIDIGWNTIERWQDVADICAALPNLRVLKAGGLRFCSVDPCTTSSPFAGLRELHLEECLLDSTSITRILSDANNFSNLTDLRLSGNALQDLSFPAHLDTPCLKSVKSLSLERNRFKDLDCVEEISRAFPRLASLSLQANRISRIGRLLPLSSKHSFPHIEVLNLASNEIKSYEFLNVLPRLFPNLLSLQVTKNPLFQQDNVSASDNTRTSDKSFYLTLARLPSLKVLNYTKISVRDRQEGELYYLSIAERELKQLLSNGVTVKKLSDRANETHPLYETLTKKHGRDSVIDSFLSTTNSAEGTSTANASSTPSQPLYPAGSLGTRLVKATFYIPYSASQPEQSRDFDHYVAKATVTLPSTLPVKQVMALLLRHPEFRNRLRPLRFNLIFESKELDPVDTTTESSTRSAIYGRKLTAEEKRTLWNEWGDWNADLLVEEALQSAQNGDVSRLPPEEDHWTEDGKFFIRNGRKWKRREVDIPHSLKRAWGDWLDDATEVTMRLEPL